MIRWKKSLLTLVPSPVLPVVGHKSFKNLLDKVTKDQSYLPVSKEKWNTQPQRGRRNPARWTAPSNPSSLLLWHPSLSATPPWFLLCMTYSFRQTAGSLKAGQAVFSWVALVLLALSWAPSDGLLVDWCHGGMGWKGGRLIPAEERGRQVQAWREWVPRMEWWCQEAQ